MLSKDPQFRKIKIKSRGVGGSATYWLGPDHLLIVTQDGYNERYRRIYYRGDRHPDYAELCTAARPGRVRTKRRARPTG